ncbi:hypothetical protein JCM11251_000658 [Rhodosporidiobolus azoricus]
MPWSPPPGQEWYYSLPSPSSTHSVLSQLLHSPPHGDPTWGRDALPRAPEEQDVRERYGCRDGKVFLGKEGEKKEWVSYQVWEPKKDVESKEADLIWCHGINDFGGKFSVHATTFLDAGYRVIVPDLPGHGRSTGIHVYLPSMEALADAVYSVLRDVLLRDSELLAENEGRAQGGVHVTQKRKVFVAGQSLGGFTAVYTCLKYGTPPSTSLPRTAGHDTSHSFHPTITGGLFLCPMLAISPESRPAYAVELAARGLIKLGAGPLGFAEANKGKNTEDPEVEEQFDLDPQTYHGKLRIATGLSILAGLEDVNSKMEHLKIPFLLCHGTGDRVTSPLGSQTLYQRASTPAADKEIKLYEGYEHILLRKGRDEKDDERRQNVLRDMKAWLERH